jgi:hypothetical protein
VKGTTRYGFGGTHTLTTMQNKSWMSNRLPDASRKREGEFNITLELGVRSQVAYGITQTIVGEIEKDWSHVVIGDLVMFRYCNLRGAARCTDRS